MNPLIAIGALIVGALGSFMAIPSLNLGNGTGTLNQLSLWTSSAGQVRLASTTAALRIPSLTSCNTIDTDGNGVFSCGTDATGGGGGGTGTISTSSPLVAPGILYATSPSTAASAATTTLTATSPLALSQPIFVIGPFASALSIDTSGTWTGNAGTASALTPGRNINGTLFDGTTNITITAASSTLLSNHNTWSGHNIFSSAFLTRASTTHATSTNQDITSLLTFGGVTGNSWDDFCTTITGGAGLCDGNDATGSGAWPFSIGTYAGQTTSASTTLLHLTGSPLSLAASTSVLTYASSTAFTTGTFFGASLSTCDPTTGKLTWAAGAFGCGTDFNTGGGGAWPFTPSTYGGVANQSTTTPLWLKDTMIIASTTLFTQASTTMLTNTGNIWLTGITNSVLSTNSAGLVVATTTIGTNYISGALGTINSTAFSRGDSITITAASSTLLSNSNTWTGLNQFSNASTTLLSGTTAWFTTFIGALTGNASTATTLQTPRNINGTSFNGSADITITAASSSLLADTNWWSGTNRFTNASTSMLTATSSVWLTSLATPAGTFLAVDNLGKIIATTSPSAGSGVWPFTPSTNFSVAVQATTTPLWFQNGLHASSTSHMSTTTFDGPIIVGTTTTHKNARLFVKDFLYYDLPLNNTFMGEMAGNFGNVTGQSNVAIGRLAGGAITSGNQNNFVGEGSGYQFTDGQFNSGLGSGALGGLRAGSNNNIGIGDNALGGGPYDNMNGNTAVGVDSMFASITLANYNTALGFNAMRNIVNGEYNIVVGQNVSLPNASASRQLNIGNVLFGTGLYNSSPGSALPTADGKIGIGTTTPWAKLAIHANSGEVNSKLFEIASSTPTATSSLFSIDNTGLASTTKFVGAGLTNCNTGNMLTYNSTTNLFGCEDDTSGGGGAWPWSLGTNYGVSVNSTSTPTWFTAGMHASSTSHFVNSSTTLATIGTGWFTNLFIGADTIAEYISDTAGAFFTGNTETGITVTYQDADNTVDVVCDTATSAIFGCISTTDWTAFNGRVSTTSIDTIGEVETLWGSINVIAATEIDSCSEFAAIMAGETGTCGSLVLSADPVFTGLVTTARASTTIFSSYGPAYFGASATSSFSTAGALTLPTPLLVASGGTGVATLTGVVLGNGTSAFTAASTQTCTNQFVRAMSAAYVATCATVAPADIDLTAAFAWTGNQDFGGASFLEIPNGTAPTANDPGEIAHDTSDNQLILDDFVVARATTKIWSVTVASTSAEFIAGGLLKVPTELDGYTMTAIRCSVDSGTSKVIAVEDASANSTEDITCATTVTSDDGSITNAAATAAEEMYIDFGATSGAVDTVSITVFGQWTRD